jgi:hypothetical protein
MGELFTTVVAGVLIFVGGQLLSRFLVDPLHEWRKLKGEIAHALVFYSNVHVAPRLHSVEFGEEAMKHYRDLASQLWQRVHAIPCHRLFVLLRLVPSWKRVQAASSGLIGLSNSVFETDPLHHMDRNKMRERVREALGLRDFE